MNIQQLVKPLIDYKIYNNHLDFEITDLVNDTREVTEGCCYIAIRGERFDGHQAVSDVVEAGAVAVIVEEWQNDWANLPACIIQVDSTYRAQAVLANHYYGQPSKKLNTIGITGTNGKTTTSTMINDLLEILNHRTGQIGTLHYKVDQKFYPAVNTTPNSLVMHQLLDEMVQFQVTDAIFEASSHALQLGRLNFVDVDVGVFTNLSREHLDFHHTMESYAFAKSLLFAQLGQQFKNDQPKLAIINQDDEYASTMMMATSAQILTYSLVSSQATVYASNIKHYERGTQFNLHFKKETYNVKIPMQGSYNVSNYLAAFLVLAFYYQYKPEQIVAATKQFKGVKGRMELVECGQPYQVIVDFAHTADALKRVLIELRSSAPSRLKVLFGHSGGNRDSGARPEIGDVLFKYADEIIFTADNPRHESVTKISKEMIGDHQEATYHIIEDRGEAIEFALDQAEDNDVILFAGKGGEPVQIIKDEEIPYNEVRFITTLLNRKYKGMNEA